MPRLSGVKATRRIKNALLEIHVIGLSLQYDIRDKSSNGNCGASAFISKEFAYTPSLKLLRKLRVAKSLKTRFLKISCDSKVARDKWISEGTLFCLHLTTKTGISWNQLVKTLSLERSQSIVFDGVADF